MTTASRVNGTAAMAADHDARPVDMLTGEVLDDDSGAIGAMTIETLNRFAADRRRIDRLRALVEERKMVLLAADDEGRKWMDELAVLETAADNVVAALHDWARKVGKASIETEMIRVTAWHKTRWAGPAMWDIFEKHRDVADSLGIRPIEGEPQVKITVR